MKKIAIVGAILFFGYLGYLFFFPADAIKLQSESNDKGVAIKNTAEIEAAEKIEAPQVPDQEIAIKKSVDNVEADPSVLNDGAIKRRKEIEQLMQEYDRYKTDKGKRIVIREKINKLMAEYNEMLLPVAIEQMRHKP